MAASFKELFPDSELNRPLDPIRPQALGSNIRGRVSALDLKEVSSGARPFDALFELNPPKPVQAEGDTEWKDFGKQFVSGIGDLGAMGAGAIEYGARQLAGEGQTPLQQGALDFAESAASGRRGAQQFSESWFQSMSPEAQARAEREVLTLDPSNTMWQGGVGEFLSTVGLKMSRAVPSTLATLLPGALLMRAGTTGGAIAYLGASEGGLSMGSIAANIATEIEQAPEAELMQSPRYQELRRELDDASARQMLIGEAQGLAPLVGGLVVGAISAAMGRYIEPVFTDKGAGILGRFGRGFAAEATQEAGQSGAEQVAQNLAAQIFDTDRQAFAGVGEAMSQGALVGGALGGTTLAAIGPRRQPEEAAPETTVPVSEAQTPSRAARPAPFDAIFQDQPATGWKGGDLEFANRPQGTAGQGALPLREPAEPRSFLDEREARDRFVESPQPSLERRSQLSDSIVLGGVSPDVQAALNARRDNKIPDLFDEPEATPRAGPGGTDMKEVWTRQEQMDLTQPPTPGTDFTLVDTPAPPGQLNLPMQERVRGIGRVPLQPMPASPLPPDDLSAPPGVSMDRQADVNAFMPAGRRPTQADFIRASGEQQRAERYAGTMRDENQQDLFAAPPSQEADQPSAEPIGDLLAQLEDLKDPDSPRRGVYLSAANIEQARGDGTFERVRGVGVPLPNFDGKGGTLIAKNRQTAEELLAMRDQGAANMQEILGHATGAGSGKPAGANIVVQQRDEKGNVVRETLVASPEEAQQLAGQFTEGGRTGVVLTAKQAILRRGSRLKQERRKLGLVPPTEKQKALQLKRQRDAEVRVAEKAVGEAVEARKQEVSSKLDEFTRPEHLEFDSSDIKRRYTRLFTRYEQAAFKEAQEPNKLTTANRQRLAEQLRATLKVNQPRSKAEGILRRAKEKAPFGLKEVARRRRETETLPEPKGTPPADAPAENEETLTEEKVRKLKPEELDVAFVRAAEKLEAPRIGGLSREEKISALLPILNRGAKKGEGYTREQLEAMSDGRLNFLAKSFLRRNKGTQRSTDALMKGMHEAFEQSGDAPVPQVGTEAEKRKLVLRKQGPSHKEVGGAVKSATLATKVSKKVIGGKKATQEVTVTPILPETASHLFVESPSKAEEHHARATEVLQALDKAILTARALLFRTRTGEYARLANDRIENENIPKDQQQRTDGALRMLKARDYLNQLFRMAKAYKAGGNRSPAALTDMRKLIDTINSAAALKPERFAIRLSELFDAEVATISGKAIRATPSLGRNREPEPTRSAGDRNRALVRRNRRLDRQLHEEAQTTKSLSLLDAHLGIDQARSLAAKIADRLESRKPAKLNDILDLMLDELRGHNTYRALAEKLRSLNMDVTVSYARLRKRRAGMFEIDLQGNKNLKLDRSWLKKMAEDLGSDPAPVFLHILMHEATHAATVGTVVTNKRMRTGLQLLLAQARVQLESRGLDTNKIYGLSNEEEFIAEAFSNIEFQQQLKSVRFNAQDTVWDRFVDWVRQLLGLEPRFNDALEAVMLLTDKLFTGKTPVQTRGHKFAYEHVDDSSMQGPVGHALNKLMQSSRITQGVRDQARNILEQNKEGGSRFLLSALTMEQIRDFYYKSFGGNDGPLAQYMKAFFQRNADNSANKEVGTKRSQEWTALTEKHGAEQAAEVSRLMTEATLYGIHPNVPITHGSNAHLTSQAQKDRHASLSKRWQALNSDWQQHYQKIQRYYTDTRKREVNLLVLNALRAYLTEGKDADLAKRDFDYTEDDIEGMKLNTRKGLEAEFGAFFADKPQALDTILEIAKIPEMHEGPYFPLMRFGNYVVTAERVKEKKAFADRKSAVAYAKQMRADDPTLSVSMPVDTANGFEVTVTEKEVRMAESRSEAEEDRKEMLATYAGGKVSDVQLKAQLYQREATISSGNALGTILDKLAGNPAAQAAVKDFYLRSLSDGAFRKREIKRSNRRGVDYDLQHRTFGNYVEASAYYTSQLRFGWQLADAMTDMQRYVRETANGEHEATISTVRMGEVVRELYTRDKATTSPFEINKWVRRGGALSQFMMLTSPSYWMINATQPWMVSLPWLAARTSMSEASAALAAAQRLIISPLLSEAKASGLGIKALFSKVAAEKSFSVLEQVETHIRNRGGARANDYIDMLETLKRGSVIDLSFVAELRDIAEGAKNTFTQRVLDASRIMAHLTEVNNRIMTAVAAYELYRNKNFTHDQAVKFAQQAVSLTQFNYSAGNSPRLFQSNLGRIVFQFMKYPQHMYALMIDNMRRAVKGGHIEAKVARKTLFGLFATHLAAGGLIGASLQPIKWAIGFMMAAFGDDDEGYTLKNAISGNTFDRLLRKGTTELFGTDLGEIAAAGLPRAAGVDLSQRMSIGTLYFIDLKANTAESFLGSLATSFGGPLVNLAAGWMRGAQYMSEGQVQKGLEFFEPKILKDVSKLYRYGQDGMTDATGKQIADPQSISPWQLFMQSLGFQPSQVAEIYARNAVAKDKQRSVNDRKANLLQRYRTGDADERAKVTKEVRAFNKEHPEALITFKQLMRSRSSGQQREQSLKKFGVVLSRREMLAAEEDEVYNIEE